MNFTFSTFRQIDLKLETGPYKDLELGADLIAGALAASFRNNSSEYNQKLALPYLRLLLNRFPNIVEVSALSSS